MFTDGPTTPLRVEALFTLLSGLGHRIKRDTVLALLQPDGLPDKKGDAAGVQTLKAAVELNLVREDDGYVTAISGGMRPVRELVLESLDRDVLAHTNVEPYFALFYAFVLGETGSSMASRTRAEWEMEFNQVVFGGETVSNRFNDTKVSGLLRWFQYAGLGWHDGRNVFQCCPVPRLIRSFPSIFARAKRLTGEGFMDALARACPELDGGELFLKANPGWDQANKLCTLGLAQALIALHEDGWLRLHCAQDSRGWSIEAAEPPNDGKTLLSGRIDAVEWLRSPGEDP